MTPGRARPRDPAAVAAHLVSLALAAGLLLYLGRGAWFHYDEWDIVGNHGLGLFQPHNEHWSTLPYLVYRVLYPLFGLRQYLPYLAVVVLLHVGVAHLAWRVMRAEGVGDLLATGLAAAFLVLGAGAENLVWAWQMGFVGSVCLGYLGLLLGATGTPGRRRDVIAALACLAAVMCSGIGLVAVLVVAVGTGLRRGWRAVAPVVGPALVGFAAWYLAAGRHAAGAGYRPSPVGSLAFTWAGLTATAEMASGLKYLGPLLVLLAVGGGAWAAARRRGHWQVAVALLAGAVGLFVLISLGRLQFGTDSARQGRYIYVAAALLLPVAGLALQRLADANRAGAAVAAILVLWAGIHGGRVLVLAEAQHAAVTENTRHLVLAAAAGIHGDGTGFDGGMRPDPVAAPTLTLGRIAGFKRDGALPAS